MNLAELSVRRPVFTTVMILVLLGTYEMEAIVRAGIAQ